MTLPLTHEPRGACYLAIVLRVRGKVLPKVDPQAPRDLPPALPYTPSLQPSGTPAVLTGKAHVPLPAA